MKTNVTCFSVNYNEDRTEGRGPIRPTGIRFLKREDAVTFASSKYYAFKWGIQASPGSSFDVSAVEPLTVYESIEEFEQVNNCVIHDQDTVDRQKALAKLTDREKKLLGL